MENLHIRYYIKMRIKLGNDATSIHNDFKSVKGSLATSYSTVLKCVNHFKNGLETLNDAPRIGHTITATIDSNIQLVRDVILDNPYCSYDEIEAQTLLTRETIERIIHDNLQMRKITSRFVSYTLSE